MTYWEHVYSNSEKKIANCFSFKAHNTTTMLRCSKSIRYSKLQSHFEAPSFSSVKILPILKRPINGALQILGQTNISS